MQGAVVGAELAASPRGWPTAGAKRVAESSLYWVASFLLRIRSNLELERCLRQARPLRLPPRSPPHPRLHRPQPSPP